MTRRRDADCPLDLCDGTGWIDVTDWPDSSQTPCPCGRAARQVDDRLIATPAQLAPLAELGMEIPDDDGPTVSPPPDLHDRIMGAIRDEQAKREAQQAIHRSYNGGGR